MTPFEIVFWPLWVLAVWACQDDRMLRFQCWMADWQAEQVAKLSTIQRGVK